MADTKTRIGIEVDSSGAVTSLRELADSTVATAAGFEKTEKMLTRLTGSAEGGRRSMDWLTPGSSPRVRGTLFN